MLSGFTDFTGPSFERQSGLLLPERQSPLPSSVSLGEIASRSNGPFVLASYQDGNLRLACDHLGQRSLYYVRRGEKLYFSESLSELALPTDDLDTSALADYFCLGYIPAPATIYRNIRRLPAGCAGVFTAEGGSIVPYWTPAFSPEERSLESAVEETETLIRQAIDRLLKQCPDAGALLSGGIDSGLVSVLSGCREVYTIGYPEAEYDERGLAALVADQHRFHHHTELLEDDILEQLPALLTRGGEPFADSSLLPTYAALRLAKQGHAAVFCGDGGDELFGGYRRYQLCWFREAMGESAAHLLGTVLSLAGRFLSAGADRRSRTATLLRTAQFLKSPFLPAYAGFQQIFSPRELAELSPELSPLFLVNWQEQSEKITSLVEKGNLLDLQNYLPYDGCRKMQIANGCVGITTLSPLLDRDVTRFALSLPLELRLSSRYRKRVLFALGKKYLPAAVLTQPKRGFGVPIAQWMRSSRMKALFQQMLREPSRWNRENFLSQKKIESLLEEHWSGSQNNADKLWALFCYMTWRSSV